MYGDALTTIARIKSRLSISSTSFDTLLTNIILGVTARIEAFCGRRFIQATYTNELHDGSDIMGGSPRTTIILKNGPVQTVSSVQYMAGTQTTPLWTDFYANDYVVDYQTGVIFFPYFGLPRGYRNIRVTYTGGFSGYSLGINNFWVFNIVPTGTVDGSNLTFTLPEAADQVIVYNDGLREAAANVTFTAGTTTFTLAAGRAPTTTIAVDYLKSAETNDADYNLPADLVEVCEEVVVAIYKRRESEGRKSETFDQSSIVWVDGWFSDEHRAVMKNYRRGYNL